MPRTAAGLLFERLPDLLFSPLASANRLRYWGLLCHLHAKRFGPDAPLPPGNGFTMRELTQDIADQLELQDAWEEEGEDPETPIGVRANNILTRFVASGWFRLEAFGLEKRINMRPPVSQFLTLMVNFAETGPVFVSGKIRSIDLNIRQVLEGEAGGDTLTETAEQARSLLEHVRNTGTSIRDIMASLALEISTAEYVRRFFDQYITQLFIGDYRELRTREHPLSRRPQILRAVEAIRESPEQRERLLAWYENKRCNGDRKRAELLFERDIQRLLDLNRIDEYLERLDDEIRRANRRVLSYLEYRLRSLRPVDELVKAAIAATLAGNPSGMGDPFPSDQLLQKEGLAEPRTKIERPPASTLRSHVPSAFETARSHVMLRARDARNLTVPKLNDYLRQEMQQKTVGVSSDLNISSVTEALCYQRLSALSLATASGSRLLSQNAAVQTRGFRIVPPADGAAERRDITGRPFNIQYRRAAKPTQEPS